MIKPSIWIRRSPWPWWLRVAYYIRKWSWCSWKHKRNRCNPGGLSTERYWHCDKCHCCGDEIDALIYRSEQEKKNEKT